MIGRQRNRQIKAYLDAGERFPYPDSSVDYIYSECICDHLGYKQLRVLSNE